MDVYVVIPETRTIMLIEDCPSIADVLPRLDELGCEYRAFDCFEAMEHYALSLGQA